MGFTCYGYCENVSLHAGSTSSVQMGTTTTPLVLVLLFCCLVSVLQAEYLKYKDPKQPLNVRIKNLLKRMTLEEKIGQMVQIERSVATPQVMKKYFIGNCSLPISNQILVPYMLYYSLLWLIVSNVFFSLFKCMICLI